MSRALRNPLVAAAVRALPAPLFALLALAACGDNQDPAGARELWRRIHAEDYRSWQRAPGYETARSSNAAHGNRVAIYVNETVAGALDSDQALQQWPEGSLIVKDGFDGSDLKLVAAMEKRADGWFWAEYDDEGDASYSGEPELCTECHESGDDGVRAFSLPSPSTSDAGL
jgi:hypothetical protein